MSAAVDGVGAADAGDSPGPRGRRPGAASTLPTTRRSPTCSRRLALLEARVRAAVDGAGAADPDPDDRFRGLYISDDQVDGLLAGPRRPDWCPPRPPTRGRRRSTASRRRADGGGRRRATSACARLARAFGLDPFDVELLLVALAPDLDPRFERLYGYLHDDVSRRRASSASRWSCGAGGQLAARPPRARLGPTGAARRRRAAAGRGADRPFLTRSLRVPDRVTAHLLGDDAPGPGVEPLLVDVASRRPSATCEPLARALAAGVAARATCASGRARPGGRSAAAALARPGAPAIALDLGRLGAERRPADDRRPRRRARPAPRRRARRRAGRVLAERGAGGRPGVRRAPVPVSWSASRAGIPAWSREPRCSLDAPVPSVGARHELWRRRRSNGDAPDGLRPGERDARVPAAPEQIVRGRPGRRAARAAPPARPMTVDDLVGRRPGPERRRAGAAGAAHRADRRLGRPRAARRSSSPAARARRPRPAPRPRARRVGHGRQRAPRAGHHGACSPATPGTGKTMSAEVVAGDLGLDLYVIDLSTVVDKYIGETEKNLDRIFTEADRVNGVLLFDEADALFGKRSEVKDAHDRYANVEVAYLLQRMERFDGLAILTTNLRANVDEAFTRRLDAVVDFPMPEEDDRLPPVGEHLPGDACPRRDDLDLDVPGPRVQLSGGNIRNICVAAAYLAAADGPPGLDGRPHPGDRARVPQARAG